MIPYQRLCAIMSWIISDSGGIKSSFQQAQEAVMADMRLGRVGSGHTVTAVYATKMTIFTQILEGLNPGVAMSPSPPSRRSRLSLEFCHGLDFRRCLGELTDEPTLMLLQVFVESKLISPSCLNVNYSAPRFHDSFSISSIYMAINLRFISFVTKSYVPISPAVRGSQLVRHKMSLNSEILSLFRLRFYLDLKS